MTEQRSNVVVIGGGTGSSALLSGLKQYPLNLSAIVTTFDSGGSSGVLREEFGFPPFGDLRKCLVALSDQNRFSESLSTASEFRFSAESSLNGHTVGNLLLAALTSMHGDVEHAVQLMSQMLGVDGEVIPVSLQSADLCARLSDGSILRGESTIDLRNGDTPGIAEVYLDPPADTNPRALEAIASADAIVMGPGDLFTSIIPNLLTGQIADAIAQSDAKKIYICNLMTKRGETGDFDASDFAREIVRYLDGTLLDAVLVNSRAIPDDILARYAEEGAGQVQHSEADLIRFTRTTLAAPMSVNHPKVRHDPDLLAKSVFKALEMVGVDAVPAANMHDSLRPVIPFSPEVAVGMSD